MTPEITVRTGSWTKRQRRWLSAIASPHVADPPDFYLTVADAWAMLGGEGPVPTEFVVADEHKRVEERIWAEKIHYSKMNFSVSSWNPLVALWSGVAGFDFVFDLAFPGGDDGKCGFPTAEITEFFGACRRYLSRLDDAAYEAAAAHVGPAVEALMVDLGDNPDARKFRDGVAFAFSERKDWAKRCLEIDDGGQYVVALLSVVDDAEFVIDFMAKTSFYFSVSFMLLHVYDLVETHGDSAGRVLDALQGHNAMNYATAPNKKALVSARKLAAKLV